MKGLGGKKWEHYVIIGISIDGLENFISKTSYAP